MDLIKPFHGYRYNLAKAGELADVIAPPYDIISPELMESLHRRSPHNVIRLILAQAKPNDDDKHNRYTRAADLWRKWRKDQVLVREDKPCIYRYQMSFTIKSPAGIVTRERPGFVALLKLHEYADHKVLPHERTLAGPKQDRFQLMLHTRAHLSQVFMLYPDAQGVIDQALGGHAPKGAPTLSCEDDAGVTHTMWPVSDPEAVRTVNDHLKTRPIYIADGHHRYETSLALHRHLQEKSPLFAQGSDYVMAYFTPVEHPGLTIFPYHRLLHGLPKRRFSGLIKKLDPFFHLERPLIGPFPPGQPRREFMTGLEERGKSGTVFGMIDGMNGQAYYLTLRPDSPHKALCHTEQETTMSCLDVVVLEELILTSLLGIKPKDLLNEKYLSYETDYDRILDAVQTPPNQTAFLMNPTPVGDVTRVADQAGIMPEKSTYFFPKLATGLVINSMED